MIKFLLFLLLFYYSWKLLGKLVFGGHEKVEKKNYNPDPPKFGRSIEKDVTNRARVVSED